MQPDDDEFISLDNAIREVQTRENISRQRQQTNYEKANNFLMNSMYMITGLTNKLKTQANYYSMFGNRLRNQSQCLSIIKETVWLTYRKNFPSLFESTHISDTGWGCMIRVGQMLLASALRKYYCTFYSKEPEITSIISSFLDDDEDKGSSINYSIQKIVKIGSTEFKIPPGAWLTPSNIAYIVEQLHNTNPLRGYEQLKIIVFNNNTLFFEQILQKMDYKLCLCKNVKIGCKVCHKKKSGVSTLIIMLSRIGLEVPETQYREILMKMIDLKQFVGLIGGKPKKALFFMGHQDSQQLIYLDPHFVQDSVNRKNLDSHLSTFFCDSYRTIDYKSIDPSLGFGFFIRDIQDLRDFHESIEKLSTQHKNEFFMYTEMKTPDYIAREIIEEKKKSVAKTSRIKELFKEEEPPDQQSFIL